MPYLILGVGVVLGALLIARWYVSAAPEDVRKVLVWAGASVLILIVGFLLFTGRSSIALVALLGLIPFLWRARGFYRLWKGLRYGGRPKPGQSSTVRTRYLEMALNHDTGQLDGVVIAGRFQGRRLSEMGGEEVIALHGEVADDPQSRQVLEAYLDRVLGPEWRTGGAAAGGPMTMDEARQILGVGAGASEQEIEAAYRDAIKRNHPDAGGSSWLAAKINGARSLLLGGRS